MSDYKHKIKNSLISKIKNIKNISIVELGVQKGTSTKLFLEICRKNNGKLYSIDVEDCSTVSNDKRWSFFKTRDDNFKYLFNSIPHQNDVIYIDTLHEADHVEKIIYNYYKKLKTNGYIFIDDISHLPYLKDKKRNNFYCEINNQETFDRILEIYSENIGSMSVEFSFSSSGLCTIRKLDNKKLKPRVKIISRKNSFKNLIRIISKKISLN